MPKRKICFVTGTRAEYGLLYWVMKEVDTDPALELQLIVTGTHLEKAYGHTVDVIEADGFSVDVSVPLDVSDTTATGITNSAAKAVDGIGRALDKLKPDLVVLLGDRYEILSAAVAATIHCIPIAHIHGGEVTEGAMDESMRHAITKLSSLHFAAAEPYRQRILQMGENPANVFTVGAPGLDHIARSQLMSESEIKSALGGTDESKYFLITMHPTTLSDDPPEHEIDALLGALESFDEIDAVFTGVNADPGRDVIAQRIESYVATHRDSARAYVSLGQQRYLSAMQHATAVIGNSSSGIIEAPAVGVPTVNIGDRQKGRLRAGSIIDCAANPDDVRSAISKAISNEFLASLEGAEKPYGEPGASSKIVGILRGHSLGTLTQKSFFDLGGLQIAS